MLAVYSMLSFCRWECDCGDLCERRGRALRHFDMSFIRPSSVRFGEQKFVLGFDGRIGIWTYHLDGSCRGKMAPGVSCDGWSTMC